MHHGGMVSSKPLPLPLYILINGLVRSVQIHSSGSSQDDHIESNNACCNHDQPPLYTTETLCTEEIPPAQAEAQLTKRFDKPKRPPATPTLAPQRPAFRLDIPAGVAFHSSPLLSFRITLIWPLSSSQPQTCLMASGCGAPANRLQQSGNNK